jgi:lactate dehydrogenase-like 2-hydroxyacid dehydrogenase
MSEGRGSESGSGDRPGIVLGFAFGGQVREAFERRFPVLGVVPRPEPALVTPEMAAARGYVTMGSIGLGEALMAALPRLSIICCFGTGFEGIDLEAARRRKITVTNGGDVNAADVADMAIALLLASARRVAQGDRYIRAGKWTARGGWLGPVAGLAEGRLGILGLGAIGARVALRAAAFGMEIGYHNRRRRDDVAWRYFETPAELASWCSYLVVALRADAGNRHLVDAALLEALGRQGHLVNISRGSVVDEAALAEALAEGVIAGAGLDVFEEEPQIHPKLLTLENVVLTPHQGGGTARSVRAMTDLVIRNLDAHFAGLPALTPVT